MLNILISLEAEHFDICSGRQRIKKMHIDYLHINGSFKYGTEVNIKNGTKVILNKHERLG